MVGVAALRSSITVIPQTPLLMAGTVRKCIDPFDRHLDSEVAAALVKVLPRWLGGLKPVILWVVGWTLGRLCEPRD